MDTYNHSQRNGTGRNIKLVTKPKSFYKNFYKKSYTYIHTCIKMKTEILSNLNYINHF